ncbi:MAG: SPFH domain-containing protein [Clostridia bacterium]|nr:SPFH domain-containing protein [Clostridia bacterium]
MINLLLLSTSAIIGIVVGAVVGLVAIGVALFLLLRKKSASYQYVEFKGDNSQLLEVVNVDAKYKADATLIVPPTHTAIIIKNGLIADVCNEGEYPLYSKKTTTPQKEVRTLKVLYISKTAKVTIRWGTKPHQRINYVDPKIGKPVSVGAFGVMDVRVCDPRKFYLELVANFGQTYSIEDLQERIRARIVDDTFRTIGKVLNEKKLSYVEFTSAKYDIQEQVSEALSGRFSEDFGFEVRNFIIENINIPEEQREDIKQVYEEDSAYDRNKVILERQQEMDEIKRSAERRRKQAEVEDQDLDDKLYVHKRDRSREEEEYATKKRHEEEERAWAREDKKAEAEERLQNKHMDTVKDIEISRSEAEKAKSAAGVTDKSLGHHCSNCGASYKPGAKFCPGCGATLPSEKMTVACPNCKTELPWGTTFCPSCGEKIGK